MADRNRDRKHDQLALDSDEELAALSAVPQDDHDQEVATQAAIEAEASLDQATAEVAEPTQEQLDADAQDPLNEEVQIAVVEAFRSEDGSPIEVSIAGLTEKFPADGSVIDVTERQARLYEESPAIERVPQAEAAA